MQPISAALLAGALALLPDTAPAQAQRPTLVVLVTVDQMRGDYLDRFGARFTGGFARLAQGGAVFNRAYQDHGLTETAPGHSTIGSGRHPASTGIVRNTEGVPDDEFPLLHVAGTGASPRRFLGTTLFDWVQRRWPRARALSVSIKDRAAILPIGRAKQHVYWYAGGQFTTSTWYADTLPTWVRAFNARLGPAIAPGATWNPLLPLSAYPEDDTAVYENDGDDLFPHMLPGDPNRAAAFLPVMPWADSVTLQLGLEGIVRLGLGHGPHPDIVHLGLSATDYIGHRFGPNSVEIHDQMLRLDLYLGQFLDSLARLVPPARTIIVLSSDHGITPFVEWARAHGQPEAGNGTRMVDSVLRDQQTSLELYLGTGRWIRFREIGLVVFDRDALRERGLDPDSIGDLLATDLGRLPILMRADSRRTLVAAGDTVADAGLRRWRHHVGRGSSGDVYLTPRPGIVLAGPTRAQHGHATDMDTWVSLVLFGPGIRPGRYDARAGTVDIAPTVARMLGVRPSERVDGRVLTEALGR